MTYKKIMKIMKQHNFIYKPFSEESYGIIQAHEMPSGGIYQDYSTRM